MKDYDGNLATRYNTFKDIYQSLRFNMIKLCNDMIQENQRRTTERYIKDNTNKVEHVHVIFFL